MGNNFKFMLKNLVMDDNMVITSANTFTTKGALSNLQNPLPTRKAISTSNTSLEFIFDLNAIDAGDRHVDTILLWLPNWMVHAAISIKANNSLSWGSPSYTQNETIQEDYDWDNNFSIYDMTGYLPSIHDIGNVPVKCQHYNTSTDIGIYRYIRILVTVASPVNFENLKLAKAFIGVGQQTTVNFNKGNKLGFADYFLSELLSSGTPTVSRKGVGQVHEFTFKTQNRLDGRLARYVMGEDLENDYCFISIEPENVNDWDEVRKHTMTLYGQLSIRDISEKLTNEYEYAVVFVEAINYRDSLEFKLQADDITNLPDDDVLVLPDLGESEEPPPEGLVLPEGTRYIKIKIWAEQNLAGAEVHSVFYDNLNFTIDGSSNLLDNPSFEEATIENTWPPCTHKWTGNNPSDTYRHTTITIGAITLNPQNGSWFYEMRGSSGTGFGHQWIDVADFIDSIDAGTAEISFSGYYVTLSDIGGNGKRNRAKFEIECWDSCGGGQILLATIFDSGFVENFSATWAQVTV